MATLEWNRCSGWAVVSHPDGHYVAAEVTGYQRGPDLRQADIVGLAVLVDGAVMTVRVDIATVLELNPAPPPSPWEARWVVRDPEVARVAASAANSALARDDR